jgi:hypothetical protein
MILFCQKQPLFYALQRGCSEDVIRIIFEAYPSAVIERDFCGTMPLFLVYHESKHPNILKFILERCPSMVHTKLSSFSRTDLLRLVFSPWEAMQSKKAERINDDPDLCNQWQKLVLTVTAAHRNTYPISREHSIYELHIALELPCPPKIVSWFARMYSFQLSIPMPDGKLPLHTIVSSKFYMSHSDCAILMDTFLELDLMTVRIKQNGKLPIHLALESGCVWERGVRSLFYSFPECRFVYDTHTLLFPFMIAAVDSTSNLNTLYQLVREGPEMLKPSWNPS